MLPLLSFFLTRCVWLYLNSQYKTKLRTFATIFNFINIDLFQRATTLSARTLFGQNGRRTLCLCKVKSQRCFGGCTSVHARASLTQSNHSLLLSGKKRENNASSIHRRAILMIFYCIRRFLSHTILSFVRSLCVGILFCSSCSSHMASAKTRSSYRSWYYHKHKENASNLGPILAKASLTFFCHLRSFVVLRISFVRETTKISVSTQHFDFEQREKDCQINSKQTFADATSKLLISHKVMITACSLPLPLSTSIYHCRAAE